ncbi:MAG: ATP-binding protein [Bacteroidetes bacterium]|nr:ATP-binding protein [Bacteroidota bacterium]
MLPSIIINLIENAIKYSFETIAIEVILKTVNSKPVLEIKDQGCGISDNEKLQVFQKFFRSGSENTRKTKGTGIGLFIVKAFAIYIKLLLKLVITNQKELFFNFSFNNVTLSGVEAN